MTILDNRSGTLTSPSRFLRWSMALALGFVLCGIGAGAHAAPAGHRHHGRAAGSPVRVADDTAFTVSGTVISVDYDANVIVIASHGDKVSVLLEPTTAIEQHGQAGSISDIRRGSRVTAAGTMRDKQRIAHSVIIK